MGNKIIYCTIKAGEISKAGQSVKLSGLFACRNNLVFAGDSGLLPADPMIRCRSPPFEFENQSFQISNGGNFMSEKLFYLKVGGRKIAVSEQVYLEYRRSIDREKYFMKDLKQGRVNVDQENMTVTYIPGREISYESLLEADWDFPSADRPAEDLLIRAQLMEKLEEALHILSDEEMELIQELFYLERTEREAAKLFQVSQNTVHYRKNKVLEKLKGAMKKFF